MKRDANPNIEHLTKSMGEGVRFIARKIEDLIGAVSGKVEAFYPVVRKQIWLEALLSWIGLVVTIPFFIIILHLTLINKNWSVDFAYSWVLVFLGVGITITLFCFLISAIYQLPDLLNPDYGTVNRIIVIGKDILRKDDGD